MKLIDANQLKRDLASALSTAEEYAKAPLKEATQIALEQPLVTYDDPSESQTIVALQCKSCGGVIDRATMTCKHCGMTHILINSSKIHPRHLDF